MHDFLRLTANYYQTTGQPAVLHYAWKARLFTMLYLQFQQQANRRFPADLTSACDTGAKDLFPGKCRKS